MVRALILTPLLVIALLVCPLRCWGAFGGAGGSLEAGVVHCGCCSGDVEEIPLDSEPNRDAPADDCACQDCLCDGAVLDAGKIDLDSAPVALLDSPVPADCLASVGGHAGDRSDSGSLSYATGRTVRVLHQSFLI